ncbi:hypothetical protein GCM10025868_11840 [Angustibacter aerolatus]|uniref:Uncharacterized protein n=1 Tax=Angustibacter aerolatus TaxID=1162965 RepID=A0ABQ6JDQ3_9ACTN|nr:hypothetical protein GCM10025868_11840 [Angustibacter aerolatus]
MPDTTSAEASTSSSGAATPDPLRPNRYGALKTPVARSSSRSGSVFTTCAPTPSSAPATTSQDGGTSPGGTPSRTTAGSVPKAVAYGTHDSTVRLSPRS